MDLVKPTICPHCGQMQPPRLSGINPDLVIVDEIAMTQEPEPAAEPQRHVLTAALDIRTLMSADIAAMIRRHGPEVVITTRDLERLGWTQRQVLDHAATAGELAVEATRLDADAAA